MLSLNKFELFGGRIKKSVVHRLVREMGQDAVIRKWGLGREEF